MAAIEKRSLMFSNKALVALTIPVILDSLLAIIAGFVDSAMVSTAGSAAVSAVSLVDAINILFITIFNGLSVGGGVIISQYIGHRDYKQAKASSNQMLYVTVVVALVFMTLLLCLQEQVIHWLYPTLDQDVFDNCKTYFMITLWGYPFSAVGGASVYVLRAMGKNRQAAATTISFNVVNVIGNSILIYGFGMGVAGAAIATTASRITYAIMGLWLAGSKKLDVRFENLLKFKLDFHLIRRILRIGSASSIEFGLFYGGRILISSLVTTFGTMMITANSVSSTVTNVGWSILGAFGTAMMPVIGQCIGADEKEQAKYYMKKMVGAGTIAMFVIFTATYLLRHQLVRIYDLDAATLEACAYYTGVYSLMGMGSMYILAFAPVSGFRAAGDVRYATVLAIFTMFTFRVALAYVLNAIFPELGLMCVCIGMGVDWACRSVCNVIRYRSGKWLYKKVI